MKKLLLCIFPIFTLIFTSCKQESKPIVPSEILKSYSKVQLQIFDLDTIQKKEIKGTKGTKIEFDRSKFDVQAGAKIQLKLKEIYDFEELVLNNINTITEDNQLLESSGVLYISFESNGKQLQLKPNEKLKVSFPDSRLDNNQLFSAKVDSLGQFKWDQLEEIKPIEDTFTMIFVENRGTKWQPIMVEVERKITDTIGYSDGDYVRVATPPKRNIINESKVYLNKFNWINIDKLINFEKKQSYNINILNDTYRILNSYILYKKRNSFVSMLS